MGREHLIGLAAIALSSALSVASTPARCKDAYDAAPADARTGAICRAAFESSRDPRHLEYGLHAYLNTGESGAAIELARALTGTTRFTTGYRALAHLHTRQLRQAQAFALAAFVGDLWSGSATELAHSALMRSQLAWRAAEYVAAAAIATAAIARDDPAQPLDEWSAVMLHIALADAHRRTGQPRAAQAALTTAIARASQPCNTAWSELKMAMLQLEPGIEGTWARRHFDNAARANAVCKDPAVDGAIRVNLVELLRHDDPAAALAQIDAADAGGTEPSLETEMLRGYLASDRGTLDEAEAHLARAAALPAPDPDWMWDIETARAELAVLRAGWFDALAAEHHYRRAIAEVTRLRRLAETRSAVVVSSHRRPYDGLFELLARGGRWRDALAVIRELDASDMLRATARESSTDRAATIEDAPAGPAAPAPAPALDDVLAAWRGRDLVIALAPALRRIGSGTERAYRLRIRDGELAGEDLGSAAELQRLAARLHTHPDDAAAGRALGARLVPHDAAHDTLDVLAIGQLGAAPLAALRDDSGALVVARRPLARVLALHRPARRGGRGDGPPVVIADPTADRPHAAASGRFVAALLGPRAQVSGSIHLLAATRLRLGQAAHASVLHLAGHVTDATLELFDGAVPAADLVAMQVAPRLAVIAACGSAASLDPEGWGSIAAALLEAGTETVIATDRDVHDDAARAVIEDFYRHPAWRTEPARALAEIQARPGAPLEAAHFLALRRAP